MPKKCEYINPDGSIWYFYNWTEDYNKIMFQMEQEMIKDPNQKTKDTERAEKYHNAVEMHLKKRLKEDSKFAERWYTLHPEAKQDNK